MVTKHVFHKKFFRKSKLDIYFCPFFKFQKNFYEIYYTFLMLLKIETVIIIFAYHHTNMLFLLYSTENNKISNKLRIILTPIIDSYHW